MSTILLLDRISKSFKTLSVNVLSDYVDCMGENRLWSPFYILHNSPEVEYEDIATIECDNNGHNIAKPYGMIDILNPQELLGKILFSKGYDELKVAKVLTEVDGIEDSVLSKMLLRLPVRDDYAEFAFDIPVISPSISLLME